MQDALMEPSLSLLEAGRRVLLRQTGHDRPETPFNADKSP
jgi:hypothetical protein